VAGDAEIIVIANIASDKVAIWEDFDARIAGPRPLFHGAFFLDIIALPGFHTPRSNLLGSAVDDLSVAHDSLDQPMVLTSAVDSLFYTHLAEVEIATIAITAMKVI